MVDTPTRYLSRHSPRRSRGPAVQGPPRVRQYSRQEYQRMIRSTHAVRAAALASAVALVLTACSSGGSDDAGSGDTEESTASAAPLKVGTLLPQTGSLAYLGPPEIAGVDLAVKE